MVKLSHWVRELWVCFWDPTAGWVIKVAERVWGEIHQEVDPVAVCSCIVILRQNLQLGLLVFSIDIFVNLIVPGLSFSDFTGFSSDPKVSWDEAALRLDDSSTSWTALVDFWVVNLRLLLVDFQIYWTPSFITFIIHYQTFLLISRLLWHLFQLLFWLD